MALQGPHHSAQKSSNTGVSDFSTSCSKAASLVWVIKSLTGVSVNYRGVRVKELGVIQALRVKTATQGRLIGYTHELALLA
ncbi:abc transporter substrate-binding protein [Lasius niger]|uniref:Abc transporter substrate-binding protein n=1 Tax=Lasius niger TaxID=67767 RepID=A0A0J7JVM9_LASNI|nr:abc transporter substrate-binding protein [Lasius niger]